MRVANHSTKTLNNRATPPGYLNLAVQTTIGAIKILIEVTTIKTRLISVSPKMVIHCKGAGKLIFPIGQTAEQVYSVGGDRIEMWRGHTAILDKSNRGLRGIKKCFFFWGGGTIIFNL